MAATSRAVAAPFLVQGADRPGPWIVTCDHATNHVPTWVGGGSLGLNDADMARHIAWDPGAAGVARALGRHLDSPVIECRFSRLVIDVNRGEEDPTLLMRLYDGTVIPGNARADEEEKERRLARLYRPYHAALATLAMGRKAPVILAIHSFTPCLKGRAPRPWQIGVLYSHRGDGLSRALIRRLQAEPDLCIGDNEPYSGHLPGDSIERHALAHGRDNALLELRNDLIADEAQQESWAARLAPILRDALADLGRAA